MLTKSPARIRSAGSSLDSDIMSERSLLPSSEEEITVVVEDKWNPMEFYDDVDNAYYRDSNRNYVKRPKDTVIDNLDSGGVINTFHNEKMKTCLSAAFLCLSFLINTTSIALTHDRVPDREKVPPLPDIVLDNINAHPELMEVPDVFVIISILSMAMVVAIHQHRWIVFRRVTFILSVLYIMRSVTMFVTVLPVSNYTVYCAPKSNSSSLGVVSKRVWELMVGGGMQITGQKKSCGDYIYSGHTVMMLTATLTVKEYGSKRLWPLKYFLTGMTWVGMGILLLARGHYTVDVLIGYYAATRMFWNYHMLANNPELVESPQNFYANAWWFKVFLYLEKNVRKLPRRKDISYH